MHPSFPSSAANLAVLHPEFAPSTQIEIVYALHVDQDSANAEPSAKLSPVFVAGHDKREPEHAEPTSTPDVTLPGESPCVADGITPEPAIGGRQGKK